MSKVTNKIFVEGFQWMNQLGKKGIPFFFVVDFELDHVKVYELDELDGIYFDFNGVKNHSFKYQDTYISIEKSAIPFMEYKSEFDKVYAQLQYGNSFLLNLTRKTQIKLNVDLKNIFLTSVAKYKLLYKDEFVVFSPEAFVKINGNQISSYPMKGTANASIPNAATKLLDNQKELSEHYTIVDLIRNDLSIVSNNVRVKKFRYLEKIRSVDKNLFQLSSEIVGDLDLNWKSRIGDILEKLLPAGSICGAPKRKTVEIIQAVEKEKRGFYTGVMGLFDGETLDSGVMIRFIEKKEDKFFFRSGGGITFQSDLNSEYSELIDKIYVPFSRNNKNSERQKN